MITLPWPDRRLSPNARTHWALKARLTKEARIAAGWAARACGIRVDGGGRVELHILFCPPSRRRYDLDNCLASNKAALDGIAEALGADDSRFHLHLQMGAPVKGGAVKVVVVNAHRP